MFAVYQVDRSLHPFSTATSSSSVGTLDGSSLSPADPSPLRPSALADIACGLARTAEAWRGRLTGHHRRRAGLRLIATPEYDVWVLYWPPGTNVAPHDHGQSAGAFAVAAGELLEIRWHGEIRRHRKIVRGEFLTVEPGVVHDVLAVDVPALSVHVYSPPLRSMNYYDDDGRRIVDRQAVEGEA